MFISLLKIFYKLNLIYAYEEEKNGFVRVFLKYDELGCGLLDTAKLISTPGHKVFRWRNRGYLKTAATAVIVTSDIGLFYVEQPLRHKITVQKTRGGLCLVKIR